LTGLNRFLRFLAILLVVLALLSGAVLLLKDAGTSALQSLPASMISAAPLLLVGVAFLFASPAMRPGWAELLKNVLLAGTFLLWGAVQLMPQNALAGRLGDLVIVLYVVDLAWAILANPGPEFNPSGPPCPPRGSD
jgi:hypothetical protein